MNKTSVCQYRFGRLVTRLDRFDVQSKFWFGRNSVTVLGRMWDYYDVVKRDNKGLIRVCVGWSDNVITLR